MLPSSLLFQMDAFASRAGFRSQSCECGVAARHDLLRAVAPRPVKNLRAVMHFVP